MRTVEIKCNSIVEQVIVQQQLLQLWEPVFFKKKSFEISIFQDTQHFSSESHSES